jgi:hypothetical protein
MALASAAFAADPPPNDFFKLPASGSPQAPVTTTNATKPTTATAATSSTSPSTAIAAGSALPSGSFQLKLYHAVLENAALIGGKYGWPYPAFLAKAGGESNLKFLEADGLAVPAPSAARLSEYVDLEADPGDGRAPATYQVYVPKPDPQRPLYGVFAYITASPTAAFPPGFTEVFEKYRLIGICPDNAGNPIITPMRQWKVLDGITAIRRKYPIDPARIYLGGTSGGGRMASQMTLMLPELFNGGYYMVGVNWYVDTYGPGGSAGFTSKATPALVNAVRARIRHVLMTGSGDFNLAGTINTVAEFEKAGFTFLLQNINGHGHAPPTGETFDQGIQFLDQPLLQNPEVLAKKAALLMTTQPCNAWLGLAQAASRAPTDAPYVADALAKAAELQTQYQAEVADCRAAVEAKEATALMKVRAAIKKWGSTIDDRLVKLDYELKPPAKGATK